MKIRVRVVQVIKHEDLHKYRVYEDLSHFNEDVVLGCYPSYAYDTAMKQRFWQRKMAWFLIDLLVPPPTTYKKGDVLEIDLRIAKVG